MRADDYNLLDRYLQNELTEQERSVFEERLKSDPAFQDELQLRQQMNSYLRTQQQLPDLKRKMEGLASQYFEKEQDTKVRSLVRKPWYVGLSIAAAIALLLVIWNPFEGGSLYDQFAEHPTLALVEKGDGLAELQAAEQAFNEQDYDTAYRLISGLTASDTANGQLELALGISALETGRLTEARSIFAKITKSDSVFQPYGVWYKALTYLKTGDHESVREVLMELSDSEPNLRAKADELLQSL